MAVSAYDQPAQAQFINTYSPVPFQEILQAGQSKQQRYDVNRAAFEQMAADANELRAIPNSADAAYIEGTVISTMQEIADKYATQDYGNQEVVRDINRHIRSNINRRLVGSIQQSEANWRQAQSIKAKMLAEGKTPFKPFDYTGYDTSAHGVYTETPRATLDYEGALQNFFSKVGEEYLGERSLASGRIGSFHGRSLNKLQEYALSNVDVAASDPAIQQYLEGLGVDPNNREAVKQVLLNEAPRFETSKMTNSYVDERAKTKYSISDTASSEALDLDLKEPVSTKYLQKRDFNEKGEIRDKGIIKPWIPLKVLANTLGKALSDEDYYMSKDNLKKEFDKQKSYWTTNKKKEREAVSAIKATYPRLNDMSDKDALDTYENAVKDFSTQSINLVGANSEVSGEFIRRYVQSNIHRDMQILDGHGKTTYNRDDVLKTLGKTEEEVLNYIKDTKKTIGGFTHQGPQPGMFFVEVPDKKGRMRRVLFSSDDQIKSATSLSNDIYKSMLTMLPSVISTGVVDSQGQPIDYQVIPDINPQTGSFDFIIVEGQQVVNENGQADFIPDYDEYGNPSIIDITEIQKLERRNLEALGIF